MMKQTLKYFDTFTGIGGFSIPLHELGHECVGFSEIDKYAQSVYLHHFPTHKPYGDITKITELPDFDLLVGGFPCQAFSIAGKRRGFEDTRGTMFFELARILQSKQPRLFVFENVKGLLSHDNGQTFRTIIATLAELGYDVQWQVLNSKDFGVPQNRERVFIIGHLRGTRRPEVFPFGGTDEETNEPSGVRQTSNPRELSRTLLARDYKDPKLVQINQPTHSNDRIYGTDGVSSTLNTMQGGSRQPKILQSTSIRRLTPLECERLQGFPEVEKCATIEVCLDNQKQIANVDSQCLKLQKHVGDAEKTDSKESVQSVRQNLNVKCQQTNKHAQSTVHINCVENGVEIHNQEKLLLHVNTATSKDLSVLPVPIDVFVQVIASIVQTVEKITNFGKEESQVNEQCLIQVFSGENVVRLFGKETMQHAVGADRDLITLQEVTKYIISSPLDLKGLEQKLKILFSYATSAIIGFIPKKIQQESILKFQINLKHGWTKYGKDGETISDTQRYKMCGNAVTVNVTRSLLKNTTCFSTVA